MSSRIWQLKIIRKKKRNIQFLHNQRNQILNQEYQVFKIEQQYRISMEGKVFKIPKKKIKTLKISELSEIVLAKIKQDKEDETLKTEEKVINKEKMNLIL